MKGTRGFDFEYSIMKVLETNSGVHYEKMQKSYQLRRSSAQTMLREEENPTFLSGRGNGNHFCAVNSEILSSLGCFVVMVFSCRSLGFADFLKGFGYVNP